MEINGEKLEFGDFLIIASGNYLEFGWYCGKGKNTLQYYSIYSPVYIFDLYKQWEEDPGKLGADYPYYYEKFAKHGFSTKLMYKNYINAVYGNRICKVANPDVLFTDRDRLEKYNRSKEALIKAKFLKP